MEYLIDLLKDSEQLDKVIINLANYVIYIYPGIITLYFYDFMNAKTTYNNQAFLVKCIAWSCVYNFIVNFFSDGKLNMLWKNVLLFIISIFVPFILFKIRNSNILKKLLTILEIDTALTEIPFELLASEGEESSCLKIYMKNCPYVYVGYVDLYEYEEGKERFIILKGYKKYNIERGAKEKLVIENNKEQEDEKVLIKFKDIQVIEKLSAERANRDIYCINNI